MNPAQTIKRLAIKCAHPFLTIAVSIVLAVGGWSIARTVALSERMAEIETHNRWMREGQTELLQRVRNIESKLLR